MTGLIVMMWVTFVSGETAGAKVPVETCAYVRAQWEAGMLVEAMTDAGPVRVERVTCESEGVS